MVENIQVGDWVVDYAGDYGRVSSIQMGVEPKATDSIRCKNWRFFKHNVGGLSTWREKIEFVFKTEEHAKVMADILAQHCDDDDDEESV